MKGPEENEQTWEYGPKFPGPLRYKLILLMTISDGLSRAVGNEGEGVELRTWEYEAPFAVWPGVEILKAMKWTAPGRYKIEPEVYESCGKPNPARMEWRDPGEVPKISSLLWWESYQHNQTEITL